MNGVDISNAMNVEYERCVVGTLLGNLLITHAVGEGHFDRL